MNGFGLPVMTVYHTEYKWNPSIFKTLVQTLVDDGGTRPPATTTVSHPHTSTTARPDTPPPVPLRTRVLFPETWLWINKTTGYVLFKGCTDITIFNQFNTPIPPHPRPFKKTNNQRSTIEGTSLIFILRSPLNLCYYCCHSL